MKKIFSIFLLLIICASCATQEKKDECRRVCGLNDYSVKSIHEYTCTCVEKEKDE